MAFKTFEVGGYRSKLAVRDDANEIESRGSVRDPNELDAGFVIEILLANAGLTEPRPGTMFCELSQEAYEQVESPVVEPHRFLALELYLRAVESQGALASSVPLEISKLRIDECGDAVTKAEQFVEDLRSLDRVRNLVTASSLKLYKTISKALYEEGRIYLDGCSKAERIMFNDVVTTAPNIVVNWGHLQATPNALAVLYNFSPYTDTGAVVASKRIRASGDRFDIISCSFANRKKIDNTIERIAAPYVVTKQFLPMIPSWSTWDSFKAFAIKAKRLAVNNINNGRNYDYVYTRTMWAPSHYAGSLIKKEFPDLDWVAEFSDPLSLDVEGVARGGELPEDKFLLDLLVDLEEEFGSVPASYRTIFSVAEIIAYARADRIIFTNHHQQSVMLEHIYSSKLRDRVAAIAEVSNHPTLPSAFYDAEEIEYSVDSDVVNLAYFGEFYATRGLTEVTTAIRMLPESLRDKVHLHVFTNYIPVGTSGARPRGMSAKAYDDLVERAISGVGAYGIEDQVHLNGSLPYLKFLSITKKFDYLLVNDAQSGEHHAVNPYLPSKWSDYAGSVAASWAFVEEGSSLAGKPANVKTPLGDIVAIANELKKIIGQKLGSA